MKKLLITTAAAAALIAAPIAGKASAAEIQQPAPHKVVVYQKYIVKTQFDWTNIQKMLEQYMNKQIVFPDFGQTNVNQSKPTTPVKPAPEAKPQTPSKPEAKPQTPAKPSTPAIPSKPVAKPNGQTTAPSKPSAPVQKPEASKPSAPSTSQPTTQLGNFEQQVVDLTNQERAKNGLPALKADATLSKVAEEKSRDMSANHYFDHNSPTYGSPFDMMKKFGVTYKSAGENIAMGQRTPAEVVKAWMESPGHRANILNSSYTHIGVGYVENGNYWTQEFIGK